MEGKVVKGTRRRAGRTVPDVMQYSNFPNFGSQFSVYAYSEVRGLVIMAILSAMRESEGYHRPSRQAETPVKTRVTLLLLAQRRNVVLLDDAGSRLETRSASGLKR